MKDVSQTSIAGDCYGTSTATLSGIWNSEHGSPIRAYVAWGREIFRAKASAESHLVDPDRRPFNRIANHERRCGRQIEPAIRRCDLANHVIVDPAKWIEIGHTNPRHIGARSTNCRNHRGFMLWENSLQCADGSRASHCRTPHQNKKSHGCRRRLISAATIW